MANVGWWASDSPLSIAIGRPYRSARRSDDAVDLSIEDLLMHVYKIGKSGSGKTKSIEHDLRQHVHKNRGFSLIDPHGDQHQAMLAYLSQLALPGRVTDEAIARLGDKLVVIEPGLQRYGVPALNVLEVPPGHVSYSIIDGIIECVHELWADCFGPRMEDVCRMSLRLLQECGLTIAEMVPLLSDDAFRNALLARCRNPEIQLYFQEYLGGMRGAEIKAWFESSRNKMSAFISNPFIRPILGQVHSTIRFREILDDGKICLINVSRDKLRESRRLLGALLVNLIHAAAVSREVIPRHRRIAHFVVVDEFHEFFCPTFPSILEGGRKFGLSLCVAHQNLTQSPFDERPGIIDTVLANSSTLMCFSVARYDAERLAAEMFHATGREIKHQDTVLFGIPTEDPKTWAMSDERSHYADELMRQRRAEVYIKRKARAEDEPWIAKIPFVPDVVPDPRKIEALRRHVAERYYRPVAEVEAEIRQRWQRIKAGHLPQPPAQRDWRR